nr:MAG TPA: hypothetical protein [Caudoviricetes sp.]
MDAHVNAPLDIIDKNRKNITSYYILLLPDKK